MALFLGRSPLPDQSFNLAIAAGGPTALLSLETLRRWPVGLYGALWMALSNPLALAGGVALLGGALVGKRGAPPLLALGLAHAGLIGLAFANARLVLPTALAAGLGLAARLRGGELRERDGPRSLPDLPRRKLLHGGQQYCHLLSLRCGQLPDKCMLDKRQHSVRVLPRRLLYFDNW
jgi:hypothetical protein